MGGMPILSTSVGPVAAVFLQGFALGVGLIVAIGAQNAFVLRQGLRREHVGAVVAFCALADAALITAGVFGMARALGDRPQLARVLALAGAAFLAWYGWKAFARMRRAGSLQAAGGGEALSRRAALAQAAAFTLLNPHVYLDTVLLVGGLGAQQPAPLQAWFAGPAGRRITAREVAMSASHGDSTERQKQGERLLAAATPELMPRGRQRRVVILGGGWSGLLMLKHALEQGLTLERELQARLFATDDAREGLTAYVEKRDPVFKGK